MTLTFNPGSSLQSNTSYTATIMNVKSSTGVSMVDYSWTFTTGN